MRSCSRRCRAGRPGRRRGPALAPATGREPRPLIEAHGAYVFGVLVAMRSLPEDDRVRATRRSTFVATPDLLVTVRKTPRGRDSRSTPPRLRPSAGRARPSVRSSIGSSTTSPRPSSSFLDADLRRDRRARGSRSTTWPPAPGADSHGGASPRAPPPSANGLATRAAVRRVLDGRSRSASTRSSRSSRAPLRRHVRDARARDRGARRRAGPSRGVRDHLQAKVAESQNDVAKKLTVIASLVLVPSLIVGFYGQNFEGAFDEALLDARRLDRPHRRSTIVQLALFRWRRWI